MSPTKVSPNNPKSKRYSAYFHGEYEIKTLKEWCVLTGKKYDTVRKRIHRFNQDCRYANPSRLELFSRYTFYSSMNKNTNLDDLVYPSVPLLHERLELITGERISISSLKSKISSSVPLSESLYNLLLEEVAETKGLLDSALTKLTREWENPDYSSITELSWMFGRKVSTVKLRMKKGASLREALLE